MRTISRPGSPLNTSVTSNLTLGGGGHRLAAGFTSGVDRDATIALLDRIGPALAGVLAPCRVRNSMVVVLVSVALNGPVRLSSAGLDRLLRRVSRDHSIAPADLYLQILWNKGRVEHGSSGSWAGGCKGCPVPRPRCPGRRLERRCTPAPATPPANIIG